MANKPKAEAVAGEVTEPAAVPETQKFELRKLRENSIELFNITTSTFDGAFHGQEADTMFSIDEAKAIIDVFLYGKEGKE